MHQGRVFKRINPSGDVVWRFQVDLTDPASGKRVQRGRSGFETRHDAQEALRDFLNELEAGKPSGKSPRLGEWLTREWLPSLRTSVRPTTWKLYETTVRAYIEPQLGGLRLEELTTSQINALYGDLIDSGLAPKTVRNTHGVLHRALRDAVRWKLLATNPASDADPPRVPRTKPETWDAEQVSRFLHSVKDDRLVAMWRLAATTGMRRGELLAVSWSDVDLDTGTVSVSKAVASYSGLAIEISETKTAAGDRQIALDAVTVEALRLHRQRQLEERLAWGEGWQDHGLVFCREDGTPLRPSWVTARLPKLAEEAGLPRLTPHGLRHTWATLALKSGVNPKIVAERLGHSSVTVSLDRYSHVMPQMDRDAAEEVAGLIT